MKRYYTLLVCGLLGFTLSVSAAPVKVLTSIAPLQLIAAELLDGVTEPQRLLPPGASPHQYSLRPSEARLIQDADLVFWVGPALERFLVKPLAAKGDQAIALLPDQPGNEATHDHDHASHADHDDDGHHHHGGIDPHIWLDPYHALQAAKTMHQAIVAEHPELQERLDANLQRFAKALVKLDQRLMARFQPLTQRGFIVFHDAYARFVSHYQLKQLDQVTINPTRKPGAKHLAQLRQRLGNQQAVCIFSEPQFSAAVLAAVVGDAPAKVVEVDPLGQGITPQAGGYIRFLDQFAETFATCLTP